MAAPAGAAKWAARAAGISGARRACSPLAAAWALRVHRKHVRRRCAGTLVCPGAQTPLSGRARRPPLCTCAALRDQLAGPLGDGVHGAEGPPRALLERTLSPPCPPARGQVPRPLLRIALGGRQGRCPFNRQPNAAWKGRVRYTPPALKGPARLGMARGHAAGAVLQFLGRLTPPCAARPGRYLLEPALRPTGPRRRQR